MTTAAQARANEIDIALEHLRDLRTSLDESQPFKKMRFFEGTDGGTNDSSLRDTSFEQNAFKLQADKNWFETTSNLIAATLLAEVDVKITSLQAEKTAL